MSHLTRWAKWIAIGATGLALVVGLAFATGRVRAAVVNWQRGPAATANAFGLGSGCNMTGAAAANCPMLKGGTAAPQTPPGASSGSGFSCH